MDLNTAIVVLVVVAIASSTVLEILRAKWSKDFWDDRRGQEEDDGEE